LLTQYGCHYGENAGKSEKAIDNISNNDKIGLSRIGIIRIYAFLLNSDKTGGAEKPGKSEKIIENSINLNEILIII